MTLFLLPFCAGGPPLSAATLYRPSAVTPVLGRRQYRLACRNCAGYKGRISVQSYRPSQRRQRGKRLRIFTTNTFLLVQLYAIGLESQSINRTSRNARGIVAVMAGHRIRSLAFPYNVDTRSKVTVTQRPVFLIMCHRTGNFTSMAAYTFRSFSSDKLIHLHPFHLMSYVFSNFAMQ